MRIYLDNCSIQRPLDDRSQIRIQLESEAILALLATCEFGEANLVSSEVLQFEINRNPHPQRQAFAIELLSISTMFVEVDEDIIQRAHELEKVGFKGIDALHLASAEAAEVDYFCTCDDRLLRRAKATGNITVKVVSPLEIAEEIIE